VKAAEYGLFACGATIAAIALAVAALDLFGL
jgi:hypothetical protein